MTVDGSDTGSWEVASRDPEARPLVSVVMLTYNHVDYIEDAILGVAQQRCDFDVELIISDDCSSDGTTKLALDYQERFPGLIRVIGSESNVGMYANHLRLLHAARGEYIAFCEGDDYWTTAEKLQNQVDLLERRSEVGLVHTAFDRLAHVRGAWRVHPGCKIGAVREGRILGEMLRSNVVQTCTAMLRANLVEDYLASELGAKRYMVADWPLFLFASARSEVAYLNASTAVYRKTPGSAMNSGLHAEMVRAESYVRLARDFAEAFDVPSAARSASERALLVHLARSSARAGSGKRAAEAWDEAARLAPLDPKERVHRKLGSWAATRVAYSRYFAIRDRFRELREFRSPRETGTRQLPQVAATPWAQPRK